MIPVSWRKPRHGKDSFKKPEPPEPLFDQVNGSLLVKVHGVRFLGGDFWAYPEDDTPFLNLTGSSLDRTTKPFGCPNTISSRPFAAAQWMA